MKIEGVGRGLRAGHLARYNGLVLRTLLHVIRSITLRVLTRARMRLLQNLATTERGPPVTAHVLCERSIYRNRPLDDNYGFNIFK